MRWARGTTPCSSACLCGQLVAGPVLGGSEEEPGHGPAGGGVVLRTANRSGGGREQAGRRGGGVGEGGGAIVTLCALGPLPTTPSSCPLPWLTHPTLPLPPTCAPGQHRLPSGGGTPHCAPRTAPPAAGTAGADSGEKACLSHIFTTATAWQPRRPQEAAAQAGIAHPPTPPPTCPRAWRPSHCSRRAACRSPASRGASSPRCCSASCCCCPPPPRPVLPLLLDPLGCCRRRR